MAEQPQNPFELVQQHIHEIVALTAADLVKAENVLRLDDGEVDKPVLSGADTPALLLRSYAIDVRPHSSSSGTEVDRTYRIVLTTGWAKDSTINAVEWKLTCALVELSKTLRSLKWEGKAFVYDVVLSTSFIDRASSTEELPFSDDLWVAQWPVKVRMRFATEFLEDEAQLCHTQADLLP